MILVYIFVGGVSTTSPQAAPAIETKSHPGEIVRETRRCRYRAFIIEKNRSKREYALMTFVERKEGERGKFDKWIGVKRGSKKIDFI